MVGKISFIIMVFTSYVDLTKNQKGAFCIVSTPSGDYSGQYCGENFEALKELAMYIKLDECTKELFKNTGDIAGEPISEICIRISEITSIKFNQ